jgi:hypothetical protein
MSITKNLIIGISDIYNEPDAIIIRSTENKDDVNIQVASSKMGVKREDLILALTEIKNFVDKREPISINQDIIVHSDI